MEGGCEIFVKTLTGRRISFDFHTEEKLKKAKVIDFMRMIQDKEGIPVDQQRLIFDGNEMEDEHSLFFYGVKKKDNIYLVLRLRGGESVKDHDSIEVSGASSTGTRYDSTKKTDWARKVGSLQGPEGQTPTLVTPETSLELTETSYRLDCPGAGLFQCSLTDLMFLMDGRGEVLYRTVQWDEGLLASTGRSPAGPLFNIDCSQGSFSQLHLPHCEIVSGSVCESLSVAHVTGGSVELVPPLRVTDSHVVVDVTDLSLWGLLRWLLPSYSMKSQVLLFLQLQGPMYTILNVIILPGNVPLSEVREKQDDTTYLRVSSNCILTRGSTYSLSCRLEETLRIQPKCFQMDWNYGPNYHPTFQVFLRPVIKEAELSLQEGGLEGEKVWSGLVPLTGASVAGETTFEEQSECAQSERAKQQLKAVRPEFVKRVSAPVLNSLLDELRRRRVITQEEEVSVKAVADSTERARQVIDIVVNKGDKACSIMKKVLLEYDSYLSKSLGLG